MVNTPSEYAAMRTLAVLGNLSSKNASHSIKEYESIASAISRRGLQTRFFCSDDIKQSRDFIIQSLHADIREFITIGGDGSLHFLVNELMNQTIIPIANVTIGIIPFGTGNDWIRNFNFQTKDDIIESIFLSQTKTIDLGKIEFQDQSIRYFTNIAGIGFNGAIIQTISKYKWAGKLSYYLALISSFFGFKAKKLTIEIAETRYSQEAFLLSVGIGQYAGGKMKLCPHAILDDGYFEVHLIPKVSLWQLICNLHRLQNGNYLKHIDCLSMRASKIEIIDHKDLVAEADGEYIGNTIQRFEIIPNGIRVYTL